MEITSLEIVPSHVVEGNYFRSNPNERDKATNNAGTQPNVSVVTGDEVGREVYLNVQLGHKRVYCLLDTGCDMSAIGCRMLADDVQLEPTTQTLTAANGTKIPVIGQVTVKFKVAGCCCSAKLLVSEVLDEFILGIDWLSQMQCRWDFGCGQLELEGRWVKLHRRPTHKPAVRRIYAEHGIEIPPRHEANVPVRVTWPNLRPCTSTWAVEPRVIGKDVVGARTLLAEGDFRSVVKVVNFSDKKFTVSEGAFMGTAEPVEVYDDVARDDLNSDGQTASSADGDRLRSMNTGNDRSRDDADLSHIQPVIDALPSELTAAQRQAACEFIRRHAEIFSKSEFDLGRTGIVKHTIDTGIAVRFADNYGDTL